MVTIGSEYFVQKGAEGNMIINPQEVAPTELFLYYFGAKWCPNCEKFLPTLISFYNEANKTSKVLEIVFVSCDPLESDALSVYESMPWLTTEFNNLKVKTFMRENGITTMPSVVLIRKNGTVAKKDCRIDIIKKGVACLEEWKAAAAIVDEISIIPKEN
mgnify:FL=1